MNAAMQSTGVECRCCHCDIPRAHAFRVAVESADEERRHIVQAWADVCGRCLDKPALFTMLVKKAKAQDARDRPGASP